MKLYTAWEVWEDVPNEDYDNLAHKKEWVRMVDLIDLIDFQRIDSEKGLVEGLPQKQIDYLKSKLREVKNNE